MSRARLAAAALAAFGTLAIGGGTASAAVAHPGMMANRALTRSATAMLVRVGEARRELRGDDATAAKHDVDLALADQARLAASAKALGVARMLPLYAEFQQDAVIGSPASAKPRVAASTGIVGTIGTGTFAALDLMKSRSHLDAARSALAAHDDPAAAKALAAVGDDVVIANVSTDLPLVTAREDLALAGAAVATGRYVEARTAFADGARALDRYAEGSPHAAAARSVAHAVRDYGTDVADDHLGATAKIDGWWSELDGWVSAPAQG